MRSVVSELWSTIVTVGVRPRTCRRRSGGGFGGVAVVAAALVLGALSFTAPAAGSDVGLVVESDASPLFTVGLSVFDASHRSMLMMVRVAIPVRPIGLSARVIR